MLARLHHRTMLPTLRYHQISLALMYCEKEDIVSFNTLKPKHLQKQKQNRKENKCHM